MSSPVNELYLEKKESVRCELQAAIQNRLQGEGLLGIFAPTEKLKTIVDETTDEMLRALWVRFTNAGDRMGIYVITDLINLKFDREGETLQ